MNSITLCYLTGRISPRYSGTPIFAPVSMREIFSISKKLWRLLLRLVVLTIGLGKQTILPNRKRKGNLLNVLFLFYIGLIESVRDFEHHSFKMANLLQNRLARKGLMLVTFLLFFLTSFEQPALSRASHSGSATVECSYQSSSYQPSYRRSIRHSFVPIQLFPAKDFPCHLSKFSKPPFTLSKRYLQIRCLLIWLNNQYLAQAQLYAFYLIKFYSREQGF